MLHFGQITPRKQSLKNTQKLAQWKAQNTFPWTSIVTSSIPDFLNSTNSFKVAIIVSLKQ